MISITMISDTHNRHRGIPNIGFGDLIIHAGDATSMGKSHEIENFLKWYGQRDYETKVLIAGNHDWGFETDPDRFSDMASLYGVTLLNDSGTEYRGIKIWGSPVQPEFHGWAFNRARTKEEVVTTGHSFIGPHWQAIPDDVDIIVTHGPAYGILDQTRLGPAGCRLLLDRISEVKPALHVCGHIHSGRGIMNSPDTVFINASSLDEQYRPYDNPVFKVDWESIRRGIID